MAVLFHQNMRIFGGGTVIRNAAYNAGFTAIAGGIGVAGPVQVAGFTEVTNNGAAAIAFGPGGAGGGLCAALGVNHLANIACGQTALARGPEYIAIGVNAALAVVSVGRIFLNAGGHGIALIHDVSPAIPPAAPWCNQVPPNATPDYRGLAYVVVNTGVANIAVGFLHNLYTLVDQRILVMGQLPYMMWRMLAGGGIAAGYIGGDFNVRVVATRGTRRIGPIYAYSAGLAAAPAAPAFPPPPPPPLPAFVPGGTTWAGSLYDYWFSMINPAGPLPVPAAGVNGTTLDTAWGAANQMSDHCAALLQI